MITAIDTIDTLINKIVIDNISKATVQKYSINRSSNFSDVTLQCLFQLINQVLIKSTRN